MSKKAPRASKKVAAAAAAPAAPLPPSPFRSAHARIATSSAPVGTRDGDLDRLLRKYTLLYSAKNPGLPAKDINDLVDADPTYTAEDSAIHARYDIAAIEHKRAVVRHNTKQKKLAEARAVAAAERARGITHPHGRRYRHASDEAYARLTHDQHAAAPAAAKLKPRVGELAALKVAEGFAREAAGPAPIAQLNAAAASQQHAAAASQSRSAAVVAVAVPAAVAAVQQRDVSEFLSTDDSESSVDRDDHAAVQARTVARYERAEKKKARAVRRAERAAELLAAGDESDSSTRR